MAWAPDYCTRDEMLAYLRIDDDVDDVEIDIAITTASREIDYATRRQFGNVREERVYTAEFDEIRGIWLVNTDDFFLTEDPITIGYDGTDSGTFEDLDMDAFKMRPANADKVGKPFEKFEMRGSSSLRLSYAEDAVAITADWGWESVPTTVQQATMLQANRVLKRRESPMGVAGSPEAGNEMRLLAKVDPDVKLMLKPYYRWWAAA